MKFPGILVVLVGSLPIPCGVQAAGNDKEVQYQDDREQAGAPELTYTKSTGETQAKILNGVSPNRTKKVSGS